MKIFSSNVLKYFCFIELELQAQQIGLLVDTYQIILTNLDAHTIDLEPYQYGGANITTLRMIDATSVSLTEYAEYMNKVAKDEMKKDEAENENPDENVKTSYGDGDEPISEDDADKKEDETGEEKQDDEGKEKEEEAENEIEGWPLCVSSIQSFIEGLICGSFFFYC